MAEADFETKRQESGMEPGESHEANSVMATVMAVKEMIGQPGMPANIQEVLVTTPYSKLPAVEQAYVAERIKKEAGLDLPDDLKPGDAAIQALERLRTEARAGAASRPRAVTEVGPTPEQRIAGAVLLAKEAFEAARDDRERETPFSIAEELESYRSQLGDDGVQEVMKRLSAAGVTDLPPAKAAGALPPADRGRAGRAPASAGTEGAADAAGARARADAGERRVERGRFDARTVKFGYDEAAGEFMEEFEEEFGDGHREARKRSLTLIELPERAKGVAEDPAKLAQLLERMQEIYRAAAVVPLYIRKDRAGKTVELYAEFKYARPKERVEVSLGQVEEEMLRLMETDDNYSRSGAYQAYARPIQQRLRREYMARKAAEAVSRLLGEPARSAGTGRAGGPADRGPGSGAGRGEARKVPRPQEVGLDSEAQVRLQAALERRLFEAYRAELADQAGDRALPYVLEQEARALVQENLGQAFEDALVALAVIRR